MRYSGQLDMAEPPDERSDGDLCLELGQRRPQAVVNAGGKGQMPTGIGSFEDQLVGPIEDRGIMVGGTEHRQDRFTGFDDDPFAVSAFVFGWHHRHPDGVLHWTVIAKQFVDGVLVE